MNTNKGLIFAFVFLALLPIWFELGGVPIGARSDGRYAAVSRDMADNGHWLIPHDENGPHLTKPPLTYWAEAVCIRWLGPTALAVRIPSAIAGSLVVIGTLLIAWRLYGRRVGLVAMGLVSVMPLSVILSRLTLTDGLLAAAWLGILAGGYFCVTQPDDDARPGRAFWCWLLWSSMAAGWMIKGPVALIPLACVLGWMITSGRIRQWRRLRLFTGMSLAILPLLLWAVVVYRHDPAVIAVWWDEVGGRLAGGGSHPKSPLFFLGVFLAGLFPASLAMDLPWFNQPWREVWARFRRGDAVYFWGWAIVLPLVLFSLPQGKLASYILPLCAPMAIFSALILENWLTGRYDYSRVEASASDALTGSAQPLRKGIFPILPPIPLALLIVTSVCYVGCIVAAGVVMGLDSIWIALPFGIVPLACVYLLKIQKQPQRRLTAMVLVWLSILLSILWGEAMATRVARPFGTPAMLAVLEQKTGLAHPPMTTFGRLDNSLSFYTGRFATSSGDIDDLHQQVAEHGRSLIISASATHWNNYLRKHPQEVGRYEQVMSWRDWPKKKHHLLLRPTIGNPLIAPPMARR